jgi:predicted nucleotidyltransferase
MQLNGIPIKYHKDIQTAATILRNEGCKSVYLFGSMITGNIHEKSDIDIGIKGLPPEKFMKTYAKLYFGLDNHIDLVDFDANTSFYSLLNRLGEVKEIEQ